MDLPSVSSEPREPMTLRSNAATVTILRNSFAWFGVLALFAIAGFWPSYVSRIAAESELRVHIHGAVMFSWLLLLTTQALLIRTGHRAWHRSLGKVSYVLVPLIVLSTLSLSHFRVRESGGEPSVDLLYFLYVQLALLGLFVLSWSLAIYHRRAPQLHARYMACTALAVVDPILARLLNTHLGVDFPTAQFMTYGFVDAVLLWLIAADWRRGPRVSVYPAMLCVFVMVEIPTFFWYKLPAWKSLALWYGRLPMP